MFHLDIAYKKILLVVNCRFLQSPVTEMMKSNSESFNTPQLLGPSKLCFAILTTLTFPLLNLYFLNFIGNYEIINFSQNLPIPKTRFYLLILLRHPILAQAF